MSKIKITDFKGVITNADTDDLDNSVLAEQINYVIHNGKLVKAPICGALISKDVIWSSTDYYSYLKAIGKVNIKRTSYGSVGQFETDEFEGAEFEVDDITTDDDLQLIGVCVDDTGKVWLFDLYTDDPEDEEGDRIDIASIAGEDFYHNIGRNPVINYKNTLRIYPGQVAEVSSHTSKPIFFGDIDRKYFWDALEVNKLVIVPANITHDYTLAEVTKDITEEGGSLPTGNTYAYKIVPVFDGFQEALLPEEQITINIEDATNPERLDDDGVVTTPKSEDNKVVRLEYTFSSFADWNPRITSFNIYRKNQDQALFNKITSVSCLGLEEDTNRLDDLDTCIAGTALYIKGQNFTDDEYAQKKLFLVDNTNDITDIAHFLSNFRDINTNTSDVLMLANSIRINLWDDRFVKINEGDEDKYLDVKWAIIDNQYNLPCYNDNDWTVTPDSAQLTVASSGTFPYLKGVTMKLSNGSSATYIEYTNSTISLDAGQEEYLISALFYQDAPAATYGSQMLIQVKFDGDWIYVNNTSTNTQSVNNNYLNNNEWNVLSGVINTGSHTSMSLRIVVGKSISSDNINFLFRNISISKYYASGTNNLYGGKNVLVSDTLNLGIENSYVGYRATLNLLTSDIRNNYNIEANVNKAIQLSENINPGARSVSVTRNYFWDQAETGVKLTLFDNGMIDGANHYLEGEVSIDVNAEYNHSVGDRVFNLNPILDPFDKAEQQDGWLTYSENGMPDVNPVSNVIKLPNTFGQKGTGLASQFGSLLVFFEHTIFKILLNENVNPGLCPIKESLVNTGNIAKEGLVTVGSDVYYIFFNGIYRVHPNVGAESDETPLNQNRISEFINDIFMALTEDEKKAIKAEYNQDYDEIIYKFKTDVVWAYNTINKTWRQIDLDLSIVLMVATPDGELLIYDYTTADLDERLFSSNNKNAEDNTTLNKASIKSKPINISDDNEIKHILRYVKTLYNSPSELEMNIYLDGVLTDDSPYKMDTSTDLYKHLIAVRGRCDVFEIEITEKTKNQLTSEINKITIETD